MGLLVTKRRQTIIKLLTQYPQINYIDIKSKQRDMKPVTYHMCLIP